MSVEFGENLRELRECTTEFTQSQIAEQLNIDRSTYTNYELGKTEPDIATIQRLAELFNVSCDELIKSGCIKDKRAEGRGNGSMETMTKSEKQVMALLWASDDPLSCTEIVALSKDKTWKDSYVHSLIKSLIKKGIVKIEAFELISRSYARKFAPRISYYEYVLLSSFSEKDIKNTKEMTALIKTIIDYADSDSLRKAVKELL